MVCLINVKKKNSFSPKIPIKDLPQNLCTLTIKKKKKKLGCSFSFSGFSSEVFLFLQSYNVASAFQTKQSICICPPGHHGTWFSWNMGCQWRMAPGCVLVLIWWNEGPHQRQAEKQHDHRINITNTSILHTPKTSEVSWFSGYNYFFQIGLYESGSDYSFLPSKYLNTCCAFESESHSVVSNSFRPHGLFHGLFKSLEFSRPEYWSGEPFPSPGNLPNPGFKPGSPALQVDSLPAAPPGKLYIWHL